MRRNRQPGLRHVSWLEFELIAGRMMERLVRSQFDVVVGLPRGGLPVAVLVSHVMQVPLSLTIKGDGKGVLVVDDILDSGAAMRDIAKKHPRAIRACVFGRKGKGVIIGERLANPDWIIFPWEFALDAEKDRADYVASHAAN